MVNVLSFRYRYRGQSYAFAATAPYTAGHQLTSPEAQALNALRVERVQENLRRAWDELTAASTAEILPEEALAQFRETLARYDANFQFIERGARREKLGALERLARELAAAQLPEGTTAEEIAALASSFEIVSEARQRLEAQSTIAASALEDLL